MILLDNYADAYKKWINAQRELDFLKPTVLKELKAMKKKVLFTPHGRFLVGTHNNWTYSKSTESAEEALFQKKERERSSKIATCSSKSVLIFNLGMKEEATTPQNSVRNTIQIQNSDT